MPWRSSLVEAAPGTSISFTNTTPTVASAHQRASGCTWRWIAGTSASTSSSTVAFGTRLGDNYEITAPIGAKGDGQVYRTTGLWHAGGRQVAIKI